MAGSDTSLVLTDASVEGQVRAALEQLDIPVGLWDLEQTDDMPGQQLAIDLFARSDEELASWIQTIQQALAGITTATPIDQYRPSRERAAS